ncbi:MAG: hypothetical protein KAX38_10095 [Candidatus Krumholzibacteria bacterium]|nr:hypothetical protein [Candidatus Krumholzibacteria bacterium]
MSCESEFPYLFSVGGAEEGLSIVGKARMELPRYRVRGIFNFRYLTSGDLRIDFRHSSLFGAYREDVSIFIHDGEMSIYDHERGNFFGNDSSLAIIGRSLGFEIYPDDILYALLLETPECSGIVSLNAESYGGDWTLTGEWRGRWINISGKKGEGTLRFRQCRDDGRGCYLIRYSYAGREGTIRYPKKIVLTRENGTERVSIEIKKLWAGVDSLGKI